MYKANKTNTRLKHIAHATNTNHWRAQGSLLGGAKFHCIVCPSSWPSSTEAFTVKGVCHTKVWGILGAPDSSGGVDTPPLYGHIYRANSEMTYSVVT